MRKWKGLILLQKTRKSSKQTLSWNEIFLILEDMETHQENSEEEVSYT